MSYPDKTVQFRDKDFAGVQYVHIAEPKGPLWYGTDPHKAQTFSHDMAMKVFEGLKANPHVTSVWTTAVDR